jgi:UDP-N-acetylmuramate dehydrogenase
MISKEHANFIVNIGKATADNVITLVAMAKTRVRNKYGIQLEEEIRYVGF